MVLAQIDIPKDLDNEIKVWGIQNGINDKRECIIELLYHCFKLIRADYKKVKE